MTPRPAKTSAPARARASHVTARAATRTVAVARNSTSSHTGALGSTSSRAGANNPPAGERDATYFTYPTSHGPITIGVAAGAIRAVALGEVPMAGERRPTELSNNCANQLLEYFAGKRTAFDVPTSPQGTAFQLDVWHALQNIPYGQVRTYAEVAEAAGHPDSFRMVGAAVKKNPLAIIVPAHRVVGSNGRVVGTDHHARLRAAFLELERRHA